MAKKGKESTTVADQIAEFIGRSMGELLNRKDSLQRQLAEVEGQIAEVGHRVSEQFVQYAPPAGTRKKGGKRAGARSRGGKSKTAAKKARRPVSPETRRKMAEAAKKRWAAVKKAARD